MGKKAKAIVSRVMNGIKKEAEAKTKEGQKAAAQKETAEQKAAQEAAADPQATQKAQETSGAKYDLSDMTPPDFEVLYVFNKKLYDNLHKLDGDLQNALQGQKIDFSKIETQDYNSFLNYVVGWKDKSSMEFSKIKADLNKVVVTSSNYLNELLDKLYNLSNNIEEAAVKKDSAALIESVNAYNDYHQEIIKHFKSLKDHDTAHSAEWQKDMDALEVDVKILQPAAQKAAQDAAEKPEPSKEETVFNVKPVDISGWLQQDAATYQKTTQKAQETSGAKYDLSDMTTRDFEVLYGFNQKLYDNLHKLDGDLHNALQGQKIDFSKIETKDKPLWKNGLRIKDKSSMEFSKIKADLNKVVVTSYNDLDELVDKLYNLSKNIEEAAVKKDSVALIESVNAYNDYHQEIITYFNGLKDNDTAHSAEWQDDMDALEVDVMMLKECLGIESSSSDNQ